MGRLMKSTSIEVIVVGREVKKAVAKKWLREKLLMIELLNLQLKNT
jgi:hypothetical protein